MERKAQQKTVKPRHEKQKEESSEEAESEAELEEAAASSKHETSSSDAAEVEEHSANGDENTSSPSSTSEESDEQSGPNRSTRATNCGRAKPNDSESEALESSSEDSSESTDEEVAVDGPNRPVASPESERSRKAQNCIFCGQDEEHDPSPEFEEYLACVVCGDRSHRECARNAQSLAADDDLSQWRCPECTENALEPGPSRQDQEHEGDEIRSRRRSSASRITRDLLPASRSGLRPGSHSVFNTLILDDDPLDGSRSLRKRKSSSDHEGPQKRPRTATSNDVDQSPERILMEKMEALSSTDHTSTRASEVRSIRPSRTPRRRISDPARSVYVSKRTPKTFVLSFHIKSSDLKDLSKRRPPPLPPPTTRPSHPTPFYAFHERENDELKSKPYGGILSDEDADTTRTLPLFADRKKFNEAREQAEEERRERAALSETETESKSRSAKLSGPPSKIKSVFFGGHEIETWYAAPYPEEYSRNRLLYICEFCLKYMNSDFVAWRHKLKCPAWHPPGDEIYRDRSVSIFEVDGRKNPVYCQNLCLLAKLFLGSKTLYYDVEPFLFYVMTEYDELGCHFVGYFSKEKRPSSLNNVSCILTLPTHQRKGYGNLLISFSYLLTRVEGKTGSPEKPLSDMGLVSYRNYWRLTLSYELRNQTGPISIPELSDRTGMTADDIIAALEGLRALVRDPVTGSYALRLDYDYYQQCIDQWESKGYVTLSPDALIWNPYIMGRSNLAHYETAPPLPTVAPREDEEDEGVKAEEGVQQALQSQVEGVAKLNGKDSDVVMRDVESEVITNGAAARMSPSSSKAMPKINGTSGTPVSEEAPNPVPATRYEIYPPVPGTQVRVKQRRSGFRTGVRRSRHNFNTTPSLGTSAHAVASVNGDSTALGTPNLDGNPDESDSSTFSSIAARDRSSQRRPQRRSELLNGDRTRKNGNTITKAGLGLEMGSMDGSIDAKPATATATTTATATATATTTSSSEDEESEADDDEESDKADGAAEEDWQADDADAEGEDDEEYEENAIEDAAESSSDGAEVDED